MGLRGIGAKSLKSKTKGKSRRKYPWDLADLVDAEKVIEFFKSLKLTSGRHAGQPFNLREWQCDITRGIYRQENGKRIVRTALATMGRKNGKTQYATGLAAAHLFGPMAEPRGEVYSAASDRNQSGRVFRELEAIILADRSLSARCNIQRFAKKIEVLSGPGEGSIYEALSSDARKAHSLSPSFVVCDELAQWPHRELYDNLVTGTGARESPLVVVISTMSNDPKHVMSELVNYGEQVNEGIVDDPSFFAAIYKTPMDVDIWDEANWYMANPALDDFRSLDELRKFAEQAKRIPAKESVLRNLYLNQPVDSILRFISRADWDACALSETDRRQLVDLLKGRPCYGGLDLSHKNDLTAFCLVFPFDDHSIVLPFFWSPKEGIDERGSQDRAPYALWEQQGHLFTTPNRVIEFDFVAKQIAELTAPYDLKAVAYDSWHIDEFQQSLKNVGADHIKLHKHDQSFKGMDPAVRAVEDLALKWALRHNGNPVLTWCMDNVRISIDAAGNRKFDKQKATGRIDGVVAMAMAANLATVQPSSEQPEYQLFFVG